MLHIHIGHDFFGAGNLGDDWTLAGFLGQLEGVRADVRLTCCIPRDADAMRRRFPQIEWFTAEPAIRRELIGAADVWLGLGDTPFQITISPHLLDFIATDLGWTEQAGIPAYFLGVGVDDRNATTVPQTRFILERTAGIWTRDAVSAELLQAVRPQSRIQDGADLSNLYFSTLPRPDEAAESDALVLNFEKEAQFSREALGGFLLAHAGRPLVWLAQEVRNLPISEMTIWGQLGPTERAALQLRIPDYLHGSLDTFIEPYDQVRACLTSRYHSALAAAWRGADVAVFTRCLKLEGLLGQVSLGRASELESRDGYARALESARPAAPEELSGLAARARQSCTDFFVHCGIASQGA